MVNSPKDSLVKYLDEEAFKPAPSRETDNYPATDRKLLASVQNRVLKTRAQYETYASVDVVRRNFLSDIHSDAGKKMSIDKTAFKITTFEVVEAEFLGLCRKLGL